MSNRLVSSTDPSFGGIILVTLITWHVKLTMHSRYLLRCEGQQCENVFISFETCNSI
jgi:hypothetical protein